VHESHGQTVVSRVVVVAETSCEIDVWSRWRVPLRVEDLLKTGGGGHSRKVFFLPNEGVRGVDVVGPGRVWYFS
jgi:hypothetical protein